VGSPRDVADTTRESRENWIAALDRLAALSPNLAIAGHAGTHGFLCDPSRAGAVSGDEPLAAVDVVGRAGDGGVGHEVNGEGGDIRRFDDAPDRRGGA